jgi:ribosomal protein S18 acetylase RimI-like enzyme
MEIRRAEIKDLNYINDLLKQVLNIHHEGRPDIFKANAKKYQDSELLEIIKDGDRPIFVAVEDEKVLGYVFCVFQKIENSNILTPIKTLYIDDLCIDENARGKGVGKALYNFAVNFAKQQNCYNLTLNVWSCNQNALEFYKKMGLVPQKTYLEKIL